MSVLLIRIEPESITSKPLMVIIETTLQATNLSSCFSRLEMKLELGVLSIALTWESKDASDARHVRSIQKEEQMT